MEKLETAVIFLASIGVVFFGDGGEALCREFFEGRGITDEQFITVIWRIIEVAIPTLSCILVLNWYKWRRVGCYPSTFIYCFNMPSASNPSGKSQVVGFFHILPDLEKGEIKAEGASFFWENGQVDVINRVGFKSSQIFGSENESEITCHIRYDINEEDWEKRFYRHGYLQFRLSKAVEVSEPKVFAGYLESSHEDVEIRSKGIAEKYSYGIIPEAEIRSSFTEGGGVLFTKLSALLREIPPPTLWKNKDHMRPNIINVWGHHIPTPQSVILSQALRPHIEGLLSKILNLLGLRNDAIERFKRLAIDKAIIEEDDPLVAYERDLKAGLIGQIKPHEKDDVLTERAKIVYSEIKPFLHGDSLLDIGCGNGMISNLAKAQFKNILLLDVVKYVPHALHLPFKLYKEGERLPINGQYDTVLLLTVLHHSNNPAELLKLAWEATRKRLIIIESVVGVHQLEPSIKYELVNLTDDDQIAYAAFVDWFYNRVLHDEVPVPYNFTTPEKWKSIFSEHNMPVTQAIQLGQDVEIGPEFHYLFVLDKPQAPQH